jgi:hypothetical protein
MRLSSTALKKTHFASNFVSSSTNAFMLIALCNFSLAG